MEACLAHFRFSPEDVVAALLADEDATGGEGTGSLLPPALAAMDRTTPRFRLHRGKKDTKVDRAFAAGRASDRVFAEAQRKRVSAMEAAEEAAFHALASRDAEQAQAGALEAAAAAATAASSSGCGGAPGGAGGTGAGAGAGPCAGGGAAAKLASFELAQSQAIARAMQGGSSWPQPRDGNTPDAGFGSGGATMHDSTYDDEYDDQYDDPVGFGEARTVPAHLVRAVALRCVSLRERACAMRTVPFSPSS